MGYTPNDASTFDNRRLPKTQEAREQEMIALAVNLAEKQLREGTASAQVITHYLKMATEKERLEREILQEQKKLVEAKTNNLKNSETSKALFDEAMDAFARYTGQKYDEEVDFF